jgi:hypothetical protein
MKLQTEILTGLVAPGDLEQISKLLGLPEKRQTEILHRRTMIVARNEKKEVVGIGSLFVLSERLPAKSGIIRDIFIDKKYDDTDAESAIALALRDEAWRLGLRDVEIIGPKPRLAAICKKLGFNVINHSLRLELGFEAS